VRPAHLIDSVVRAFRWHRRWFAAILASVAVLAALDALSPDVSGTVPVVVAAHEIPGGSTLAATDLMVVEVPAALVADGAFSDLSALTGGQVVATVPARRQLTAADLLDAHSLVGAGKVAVPARFGDADAVAILKVGSELDVLGQRSSGATVSVVAAGVRVVAMPGADGGGVLGSASGAGLVLVEADQAQAEAILTAASVGALGYVLR